MDSKQVLVVICVLVVVYCAFHYKDGCTDAVPDADSIDPFTSGSGGPLGGPPGGPPPLLDTAGVFSDGCVGGCSAPEQEIPPLYHSSEIDEIITGNLYRRGERERVVYAARTAHGGGWGLEEYADGGGGPGDVGYDVGPIGAAPAGNRSCAYPKYDDGIPSNWNFPSTPVHWYSSVGEDYYGAEGPTVYCGTGLALTSVGDHDPLQN